MQSSKKQIQYTLWYHIFLTYLTQGKFGICFNKKQKNYWKIQMIIKHPKERNTLFSFSVKSFLKIKIYIKDMPIISGKSNVTQHYEGSLPCLNFRYVSQEE